MIRSPVRAGFPAAGLAVVAAAGVPGGPPARVRRAPQAGQVPARAGRPDAVIIRVVAIILRSVWQHGQ